VVHERDLARHRPVAPAAPPGVREGVAGGAARAGGGQGRTVSGEAGDAVDTRGLNGFGEDRPGRMVGHRRASMDLPAPGGPMRDVVVTTPASASASPRARRAQPPGGPKLEGVLNWAGHGIILWRYAGWRASAWLPAAESG
jgi:hypothetical protein